LNDRWPFFLSNWNHSNKVSTTYQVSNS